MHRSAHKISFERTDLDAEGGSRLPIKNVQSKAHHSKRTKAMLVIVEFVCAEQHSSARIFMGQTLNIMSP